MHMSIATKRLHNEHDKRSAASLLTIYYAVRIKRLLTDMDFKYFYNTVSCNNY